MDASRRRFYAALAIALFIFSLFPALALAAAPSSTTPSKATNLEITASPPRLPADGKTYGAVTVALQDPNSNPSLALAPLTVYLSSSVTAVATVPTSVVLGIGRDFVTVNVTTTQYPGETTITASASGLASQSVVLTTLAPSGFASKLAVTPNPSTVLEGSPGSLIVQLEDATGAVARASSNVVVTLTSADNASVSVTTPTVTIDAGSETGIANYTAGYVAGQVTVTASSPGFEAATTQVTISASSPVGIVVNAEPSEVVEGGTGQAVVWLSNSLGFPAVASQNESITLTSSDLGVVRLFDTNIVIPQGQFSTIVNFTGGSVQGFASITASAQGLASGFSTVDTFPSATQATALRLFISPDPTLANGGLFRSILVAITNSSGYPSTAAGNVKVNITSSNSFVGTVVNTITIASGTEYGTVLFASQFLVGTTVITASAQDLISAQAEASTFGPVPVGLSLTLASPSVPANGVTSSNVAIALVDINGHPAVAPSNIEIQLTSSKPNVASVPATLTIPAGGSYVLANLKAGISPGLTLLTVTAAGYGSSSAQLTTTAPAPSRLAVFASPTTALNSTITNDGTVAVQLQDANGYPADAVSATTVTVTSSNTTVLKGPFTLTFSPGSDLAWTKIETSVSGNTNLTASAPGLSSSAAKLTVLVSPEVLVLAPSQVFVYDNDTKLPITLTFTVLGSGVENATVIWNTTLGTISPPNSTTTSAGFAQTDLSSLSTGAATITGVVSDPLIGTVNVTTVVSVIPVPAKPTKSIFSGIGHDLIYVILAVVVLLLVLAFVFLRRRRAKRREVLGEGAQEDLGTDEGSPFDENAGDDGPPMGPG